MNNLNPEIVEFLHKNNKKMIIEKASNKELELLTDANFKQNIRASLDHDAITHILKRHGVNSVNVKNGESPITNEDIANYRYIVNNADAILRTIDKYGKEAITAFKQVNGYAVVVEQAINKKNELALKTMYKNNGSYKNNEVYKEFSSTSLDANAKVPHGLSSHSGATENPTQKPLTSQEDLLKTRENLNETTPKPTNLSPLEQANTENIKNEVKKLENQIIETTTRLLTSYQIFLKQARDNANHQITENKTQSLEALNQAKTTANNEISENKTQAITNINQAKENATNQINTNKQEVLNNITQEKQEATSEIIEAKNTIIIKTLIFLRLNKAC
ncbi:DUF3519 domain-containing protein [Helicobacter pylori]|uniref:DUF3519 domain-containing protein n=1 Tax=Helicobacter pylori TaxID=210 RepID=A0AB74KKY4_HELPX|nr:DUF3519 domain-containing protein [Helicobacter pylori]TLR83884.1 DUF3519 domain-containing protein [Helicobacter pylori]TLR89952.1 DUF3519 domain-containing protein [Helicobacter pylori]